MASYDLYQTQEKLRREEVVRDHLQMVYGVARRVANATAMDTLETSDLVQAGVFGLYRAMDKFDATKGVPFGAYAQHYVKGAMLDELRKSKQMPRSIRDKNTKVKNACDALSQSLMRTPTDEELADFLGITSEQMSNWLMDLAWTSVWSVEDLESQSTFDVIDETHQNSPSETMDLKEGKAVLVQALKRLSPKEQQVLYAYYEEELTLREIAYVMNLSEAYISRIHSKAILRLRGMLGRKKADLVL